MKQLWHNPRCSKSRAAHALLTDAGVAFETRLYLKEPPDTNEIVILTQALGLGPDRMIEMVRTHEKEWGPYKDDPPVNAMAYGFLLATTPILLERPIFYVDGKAVIGRPPERVLTLL